MVSSVGQSYNRRFTAYDVRFAALMDAYERGILHRDVSLGNIILARLKEKTERVGYLVDWELSCKLNRAAARDHVLTVRLMLLTRVEGPYILSKGTPAFMSIGVLSGKRHCLEDDLESFVYVVLYAALRWLPVDSEHSLHWWMTDFFGAPRPDGTGGGEDAKRANVVRRKYTDDLRSETTPHVVEWLKAAMDLHMLDETCNPLWKGGEALRKMWEEILAKDLPSNDRVENEIPGMKMRHGDSLHATYTMSTSGQDLYKSRNDPTQPPAPAPTKRRRANSADDNLLPPAPKSSKQSR